LLEIGVERIMFCVDYPHCLMEEAQSFLQHLPVSGGQGAHCAWQCGAPPRSLTVRMSRPGQSRHGRRPAPAAPTVGKATKSENNDRSSPPSRGRTASMLLSVRFHTTKTFSG
jgi:hypothetical protein